MSVKANIHTLHTLRVNSVDIAYYEQGTGPLVICLHGFPDTANSMQPLVETLAAAGYRAVAPFLRGYYPSALAADGDYSLPTVARDIIALIEALYEGDDEPKAAVVGHDWGGLTAYHVANLCPQRVMSLTVMSVPHMHSAKLSWKQFKNGWYIMFFQIPWLPEKVIPRHQYRFIERLYRLWSPSWADNASHIDNFKQMAAHPGALAAILAYYRCMVGHATPEAKALIAQQTTVPALWFLGDEDGCVALDQVENLDASFTKGVEFHLVKGAGHFPHCEKPAMVLPLIKDFIGRHVD